MTRSHLLVAAALVAAVLPARAAGQAYPTDRGSFIVGGSAEATTSRIYTESDGEREQVGASFLHIAPAVQYFVAPGLALGGRLSVSMVTDEGDTSAQFGVGPQISYYFGRGERPYHPYLSAGASYQGFGDGEHGVGQNAQAGMVFLLSRGIGLDTSLSYRRQRFDDVRLESLGLALGITAFVF